MRVVYVNRSGRRPHPSYSPRYILQRPQTKAEYHALSAKAKAVTDKRPKVLFIDIDQWSSQVGMRRACDRSSAGGTQHDLTGSLSTRSNNATGQRHVHHLARGLQALGGARRRRLDPQR